MTMKFLRRCAALALTLAFAVTTIAAAAPKVHPRPFGRGNATYHATAIAPYTFESTTLRVRFDVAKGRVFGGG